jgi:hypothetical protein
MKYLARDILTVQGDVRLQRAYYYCQRCHISYFPWDEVVGLADSLSPGLLPLVCLVGTLVPFAEAGDALQRLTGLRLSASTVLRSSAGEGERLRAQLRAGGLVDPTQAEPGWAAAREPGQARAYLGLDAFSVPMQGPGATPSEHRMLYTARLYTPDKRHSRYLVDFDLEALAEQLRPLTRSGGVRDVNELIAVTDGGNGLEEALHRQLADNLVTILDWYHAAQHLHAFATQRFPQDPEAAERWSRRAKGILYERGGEALLVDLHQPEQCAHLRGEVREGLRKLIGYFERNRHRTDYPSYRQRGWDIGSGPTEAGCKLIGQRLKGAGMRWVESGAATIGALRAPYLSGPKLWDGFWEQPRRAA